MFFSTWLEHLNFLSLVEEVWTSANIQGQKLFIYKEKLKLLNLRLKAWNVEVFGNFDLQVE